MARTSCARFRRYGFAAALTLLPLLASVSCGDDAFRVERSAEFPKAGATFSVFGVFKDGRLAPEAWDQLRPYLKPLFGAAICDAGYPDAVSSSGSALVTAVDNFSRANGVTDELLDRLAPMAMSDLILLFMMTGRPTSQADVQNAGAPAAPPSFRAGRRSAPTQTAARRTGSDTVAFEVMATVFSVRAHHSVGGVSMTYTGSSLDDALRDFAARLGKEMPRSSCEGWKHDVPVDVEQIRRLEAEMSGATP